MTHYKLLAELDKRIERTHEMGGCHPEQHALRAIVDLHTPVMGNTLELCSECMNSRDIHGPVITYPCHTIQAILSHYPSHREGVVMITCSNCDGLGWLYLSEFREVTSEGVIGDDHSTVFTKSDFDDAISVCPDCDGFGEESDEDYAEDLAIMKIIDDYENRRGFYRYYTIDFDAHKVTMGIDFMSRGRRWNIIHGLPTFSKFARMWK